MKWKTYEQQQNTDLQLLNTGIQPKAWTIFFCQVYYSFSPLGIKQLNVLNSQAGGGLLWVMRLTSMDHVEQFSKNNQRSENRKLNQIEKLMSKPLFFLVTSLCLLSSE